MNCLDEYNVKFHDNSHNLFQSKLIVYINLAFFITLQIITMKCIIVYYEQYLRGKQNCHLEEVGKF